MEEKKNGNQHPEIKDEEMDSVSGGVVIPGRPIYGACWRCGKVDRLTSGGLCESCAAAEDGE